MQPNDTKETSHLALNGFGETLRQARTQKNLTLEEAAKDTFILKRHLQALEEENYEALPQATFAKGFATNYAKYLGLDAAAIGQQFEASYPSHLRPKSAKDIRSPLQPMGTLTRESRGGIKINPFFILGLLAAIGLGIFIFKTVNKAHNDTTTATPASATSAMTPQDQAKGAALNNTGSALSSTGSALPSAGTALSNAGSAVGSATTTTSQLDVLVKDATTVNVTDATGKALLQGEQTKGSYKVSGQPPFNVMIDNIKNVNMDMNKQPIKLSDYIPAGQTQTNQANFTLK